MRNSRLGNAERQRGGCHGADGNCSEERIRAMKRATLPFFCFDTSSSAAEVGSDGDGDLVRAANCSAMTFLIALSRDLPATAGSENPSFFSKSFCGCYDYFICFLVRRWTGSLTTRFHLSRRICHHSCLVMGVQTLLVGVPALSLLVPPETRQMLDGWFNRRQVTTWGIQAVGKRSRKCKRGGMHHGKSMVLVFGW